MNTYTKIWQKRDRKIKDSRNKIDGLDINNHNSGPKIDDSQFKINGSKLKEEFNVLSPEEIHRENKKIKTEKRARKVLKHSGTIIFIVSVFLTFVILLPFVRTATKQNSIPGKDVPTVDVVREEEARVIKEAEAMGVDARFSIYVPKINAKSKVLENVDMNNEKEYLDALKQGVAHGKGTYFPGQGKNIFLFSHSVSEPEYIKEYNAVFYDLRDLDIGDEIIIYFSGIKYLYRVIEKDIASASDTSFLAKDFGGETLILQTCDPPGTTLRRLLVIARLTE